MLKRIILYGLMAACMQVAHAQVQVVSSIDSIQILIGEQAHLTVDVSMPRNGRLEWPSYQPLQHLTPGVEVVESSVPDTLPLDNDLMKVRRVYTLTSFDDTLYYLPPMTVKVDGKDYSTKSLALKVLTVPVDTLHPENFFPPKDVQDNPFLWKEWSPLFWMSVVVVLLFALLAYLMERLKTNKPVIARVRFVRHIPPHQKAMDEIAKIKAEKMQASEDQKTYYTRLTDTLRRYIEERFGFNAMEMTSAEIIDRLQTADHSQMIDELRELFATADLVKFAKYSTLMNENDANLVNAIDFIDKTKQDTVVQTERQEPQLSETEIRSMRSRRTLKWGIVATALSMVSLLAYVAYRLSLLL